MITKMRGISLGVLTADCVPIILYDSKNKIIGCIHAGWRGAFKDIIKNTIHKFKKISLNKVYKVQAVQVIKTMRLMINFTKNLFRKIKKKIFIYQKK